ncbi:MAG: hypothetical protein U9R79_11905 [Armatimonadota bacterium]|nr:hypothetical protein [Armatimonadota bacterium]
MYDLKPARVYALADVLNDELSLRRMERMLAAMGLNREDVSVFEPAHLPAVVEDLFEAWSPEEVLSGQEGCFRRPLIFTRIRIEEEPPELDELLQACPEGTAKSQLLHALGFIELVRHSHPREDDWEKDYVCWPTMDFGTMIGCPHGCQYCGHGKSGRFIAVGVNLEEYMQRVVAPTVEENQWQRCFRMIGWGADHICWEPEYDCMRPFLQTLAERDRYGYFHSTSENVDWIAELPHRDRLIAIWSTTCETVAREIEPGSGRAVGRIEAARRLQQMGIPVRFKFKPMIPIRGWREEYAQIIEQMLALTEPESIGFCVIMWNTMASLEQKIDLKLLEPEYVQAARDAADELEGVITGPFPHEVRAEVYRYLIEQVRRWDEQVPLYISTESREMWDEMAGELGQRPETFFCGCSSVALPGRTLAVSKDCPHSTYRRLQEEPAEA